jgi:hypothetical protein
LLVFFPRVVNSGACESRTLRLQEFRGSFVGKETWHGNFDILRNWWHLKLL